MRVGLVPPMWSEGAEAPSWPKLRRYAREAEALGFDSLWIADDAIFRFEGETLGIFGCIPTATGLAAVTERIGIGTLVANVHARSPALLAKDADTLAAFSDGRFVLGLGAGDDEAQHRALGMRWEQRFGAYEEAVEIITSLLREGHTDFEGDFYRARDAELRPRGPQPRGPKILVGGRGKRMLRIAVEKADIWNGYLAWRAGDPAELLALVDAACERHGREPASLERSLGVAACFGDAPLMVGGAVLADTGARGGPAEVAAYLAELEALGVGLVQVQTAPLDLRGMELLAAAVELL
ncbi:MAG: LLM class flavin-dependent oxidoreductase [Actinobacteria bacterium]|nr:LLM class flavin-dependent oxidoreductase [Actinomycetota bacterium]